MPTFAGPGWVQLSSAPECLTAVFGMGTGVTTPLKAPRVVFPNFKAIKKVKLLFAIKIFKKTEKRTTY